MVCGPRPRDLQRISRIFSIAILKSNQGGAFAPHFYFQHVIYAQSNNRLFPVIFWI